MFVMHVTLGGCLKAPPIEFGLSEDTGGHIAYVIDVAKHQAKIGARVEIVTRAFRCFGPDYDLDSEHVATNVTIHRLRTARTDYLAKESLWNELGALADALRERLLQGPRPDVIHAHFADAAEIAFAATEGLGISVVYTPHSLALDKGEGRSTRRALAEAAAIDRAAAIIVSSRDEAERQVTSYSAAAIGRVHRISPGVTTEATTGPERAAALLAPWLDHASKPMILAVARPVAKKNLISLVRAYRADAELQARANLVIVAGQHACARDEAAGVLSDLRREGAGLRGRFAFPPAHIAKDVASLYRLAAETRGVFVNPALSEPFGLTLLEAAAVGLPVVATRNGGPTRIVADMQNGTLVDPLDTAAIAAACKSYLFDDSLWDTASGNAKRGIGQFSWTRYADASIALYRSLGRRKRARVGTRLVVCDIDNTLTGCRVGAVQFRDWVAASPYPFVVATGRSLPEARAVLRQWQLPEPEVFVTSLGSEVFIDRGGIPTLWQAHAERIDWDRDAVLSLLMTLGLEWQGAVDQKRAKLSLFGDAADAARIRQALRGAGLAAQVIHSHGRLIDVLPVGGGKAGAIAMVAERYGLTLSDCIAAGDSGNDFDMLSLCGTAIVVGNASEELLALRPRAGLLRVEALHANGVLEGLRAAGLS